MPITEEQLRTLQSQLKKNNADIASIIKRLDKRDKFQLNWPLDLGSIQAVKKATDNFQLNKIMDLLWRKIFTYLTFFESLDGITVSGSPTIDGTQISIPTTASTGNQAYILKAPVNEAILDFGLNIFLRTGFQVDSVSNNTDYLVVGQALNSTGDKYFGFKISGSTLYGVASGNGTSNEQTVSLGTISASTVYSVEARFYARIGKIVFFLNPTVASMTPAGVLTDTTKFPTGIFTNLYNYSSKTGANAVKTLKVSYFRYMQQLNIIN